MRLTKDQLNAVRTTFTLKFTEAMNQAKPAMLYPTFCTDCGDENFSIVEVPFLEQFGFMREWIGDRQIKNLADRALKLTEKPFEETIGISQRDLETGAWKVKAFIIAVLGRSGVQNWETLFIEAICNPKTWIDGKAFFASDRKYGDKGTASIINNTTSSALSATTFAAAYTAMTSYTGSAKKPLHVKPTDILVGPALLDTAKEILESEKIRDSNNNEVNNPHRGKVKIQVSGDLVGKYANYWFLADNGGVVKPVALQRSKEAELVLLNSPTDEMVFMTGKALFGVSAYGSAAAAMPHLIYRGGSLVE